MSQRTSPNISPPVRFTALHRRTASRSPSRSPTRQRFAAHELDPLLSNLSPKSTLEALRATEVVTTDEKSAQDVLRRSIAQASTAERALGIRAALAGQKLREWHAELAGWDWPKHNGEKGTNGFQPPKTSFKAATPAVDEYFGSLSATTLEHYEDRINEIKDGLEALDVEELKEHVLSAHIPSRSRPSSSEGPLSAHAKPLTYVQLRDFTAVITATILQALPFLMRLSLLLNVWDVRLLVSRHIPELLDGLITIRLNLDQAIRTIKPTADSIRRPSLNRERYNAIRKALEAQVSQIGTQMDFLLDSLEGREDTLPGEWIDQLDSVESDFSNWVVDAEHAVLENEWMSEREKQIPVERETIIVHSEEAEWLRTANKLGSTSSPVIRAEEGVVDPSSPGNEESGSIIRAEILNKSVREAIPADITNVGMSSHLVTSGFDVPPDGHVTLVNDTMSPEQRYRQTSQAPNEEIVDLQASELAIAHSPTALPHSSASEPKTPKILLLSDNATDGPILLDDDDGSTEATILADLPLAEAQEVLHLPDHNAPAKYSLPTNEARAFQLDLPQESAAPAVLPEDKPSIQDVKPADIELVATRSPLEVPNETKDAGFDEYNEFSIGEDPLDNLHFETKADNQPDTTLDATEDIGEEMIGVALTKDNTLSENSSSDYNSRDDIDCGSPVSIDASQNSEDMVPPSPDLERAAIHPMDLIHAPSSLNSNTEVSDALSEATNKPEMSQELDHQLSIDDTVYHASTNKTVPLLDEHRLISGTPEHLERTTDDNSKDGLDEPSVLSRTTSNSKNVRNLRIDSMPEFLPNPEQLTPESGHSGYFSDLSTPEIQDASTAELFGTASPVVIKSPPRKRQDESTSPVTPSRNTSQRTVRPDVQEADPEFRPASHASHVRAPSFMSESSVSESDETTESDLSPTRNTAELKRASVASIEHFTPRDVRSVQIRQSGSFDFFPPVPHSVDKTYQAPGDPNEGHGDQSPSLPSRHVGRDYLLPDFESPFEKRGEDHSETTLDGGLPPLPRRSSKRVSRLPTLSPLASPVKSDNSALSPTSSIPLPTSSPRKPPSAIRSSPSVRVASSRAHASSTSGLPPSPPLKSTDEHLEQRISSILHTIPARIRLASGPPATRKASNTLEPDSANNNSSSSSSLATRSSTPTPSLTLSPVSARQSQQNQFRSSNSNSNSGIRLYNLYQSGRDAPIKLHVRLVGERGERVMVRTGGGWADLGEWLRDYALHHGSRGGASLTENRFEVERLPTPYTQNSASGRTGSVGGGRLTPGGGKESAYKTRHPSVETMPVEDTVPLSEEDKEDWPPPVPSLPSSILSRKYVGPEPATSNSYPVLTPSSNSELYIQKVSRNFSQPLPVLSNTSTPIHSPTSLSYPTSTTANSTPNQGQAQGYSQSSSANTTPLAPGGPKSRAGSLSAEKQAWIDNMMGAARKVSESQTQTQAQSQAPRLKHRNTDLSNDSPSAMRRKSFGGGIFGEGTKEGKADRPTSGLGFGDLGSVRGTKRLWLRTIGGKGKGKEP